jgi:hypothetical protein
MEDKSEISYWFEDTDILTVPTSKVPTVGEEIYFNTQMDREWYESNFPTNAKVNFFNEGVRGHFIVTDVKRYYKTYDYKHETDFGLEDTKKYVLPSQRTVETFEVYVERKVDSNN